MLRRKLSVMAAGVQSLGASLGRGGDKREVVFRGYRSVG